MRVSPALETIASKVGTQGQIVEQVWAVTRDDDLRLARRASCLSRKAALAAGCSAVSGSSIPTSDGGA
ncbi:MAG: hypothetical protein IPN78_18445 [Candidatus Accumulibacter sp.]|nr:hypothetical protein [Candidatus Accumulibacter propinquus]